MSFSTIRAAYQQLYVNRQPALAHNLDMLSHDDALLTHAAWKVSDVRAMEQPLLDAGKPLMALAAHTIAQGALALLRARGIRVAQAHVVAAIGGGNNGGDGLFAACELSELGVQVTLVCTSATPHPQGLQAALQAGCTLHMLEDTAHSSNINVDGDSTAHSEGSTVDNEQVLHDIVQADLIIDALAGIGIQGALRGTTGHLVSQLRTAQQTMEHFPAVLAVDTPSGLGVDDGTVPGPVLQATMTVACGVLKPCHLLPPAAYQCGDVIIAQLGFDLTIAQPSVLHADLVASWCTQPATLNDSKYARGVVGLVTGSHSYPGAALLSTQSASKSGVGMVRYSGPEFLQAMVVAQSPEAVVGLGKADAWVVGSGVPDALHAQHTGEADREQRQAIVTLIHQIEHAAEQETTTPHPLIFDAGAFDVVTQHHNHFTYAILTPHVAECARVLSALQPDQPTSVQDVLDHPLECATRLWQLTGATVLLKGAHTVIVGGKRGEEPTVLVADNACSWMATAGSGDVLAGLTGALCASAQAYLDHHEVLAGQTDKQHTQDSYTLADLLPVLAAAGAHWHGFAGRLASGADRAAGVMYPPCDPQQPQLVLQAWLRSQMRNSGKPIIASDIIERVPAAMQAAYHVN